MKSRMLTIHMKMINSIWVWLPSIQWARCENSIQQGIWTIYIFWINLSFEDGENSI
jgi:hypothetical protein